MTQPKSNLNWLSEFVHELFESRVLAQPDASAVVAGAETVSFAELNERANRLAHYLILLGVVPEMRVAVFAERTVDTVVAILAILKAGGCYLPLDGSHPTLRLQHMLVRGQVSLALTQGHRVADLMASLENLRCLDLRRDAAAWQEYSSANIPVEAIGLNSKHLAYVIYTSGSTGLPKGVSVEHLSLCNLVAAEVEELRSVLGSRILQAASFSYDASMFEIFMALCGGGTLCLPYRDVVLVGEELAKALEENRITHLTITPTALDTLGPHCELPYLKTLVVAGEPLSATSVRRWAPRRRVLNAYGPTEATVCATWYECDAFDENAPAIGRPLPSVCVYVLDGLGRRLSVGEIGEVFIGGPGVGRGYLGEPELTAERFLCDPFSNKPDARMFRTGDLGRFLPDGNLEFVGRNDAQAKISGVRIELGEIEEQLRAHESIQQARVIVREDFQGSKRLVAYYSSFANRDLDPSELHAHLSRTLPANMRPTAYVRMKAWPLTQSGKLENSALPLPQSKDSVKSAYEAPVGQVEESLAGFWIDLLGVERVGRHDDFFKLGGNSLLATLLVSRIRAKLSSEVSVKRIFELPVLRDLAGALSRMTNLVSAASASSPVETSRRLSAAELRLWFLAQSDTVAQAYHISIGPSSWMKRSGLRLNGDLDPAALRRALDLLMSRHEALRTVFVAESDEITLRVGRPDTRFLLREHDLRNGCDPSAELARLKSEESRAAFDLERGPLIRGRLIRILDDDYVLLLTAHHIVCDGWSAELLLGELADCYNAFTDGREVELDPPAFQYSDYVASQNRWLASSESRRQEDYWASQLSGVSGALDLPKDFSLPARRELTGDFVELEFSTGLTKGIKELSERCGATVYATLAAAWALVLGKLSGQDDIAIGSPFAGRTQLQLEELVGCLVNTVVMRLKLSRFSNVVELIKTAAIQAADAQQFQGVPFQRVVEVVNPRRHAGELPLFQVMLSWQNHDRANVDFAGLVVTAEEMPDRSSKFDLELRLGEDNGRIRGILQYSVQLFEKATIERHVDCLRTVLVAIIRNEWQRLESVDLLSVDARQCLLLQSGSALVDRLDRGFVFVHELFEARALEVPNDVAIVSGADLLTYSELNGRANRLAYYLRGLGVAPGSHVAICLERGVERIVGLLGVLKAGGAYVPLDPSYPAERLAHIVSDSQVEIVLIDELISAGLRERLRSAAKTGLSLVDLTKESNEPNDASGYDLKLDNDALSKTDLAYIIYTSGTTGKPKGVGMSHDAVSNLINWQLATFDRAATLQFAPLSFDVSFQEIFSTLCGGGRLVFVEESARYDSRKLFELIRSEGVERAFLPYVALRMLAESSVGRSLENCKLRQIVTAGEQLRITPSIVRLFSELKTCSLHNHYGPTETHVITMFELPHDLAAWPELPPIGRPIPNANIYILDLEERLVPDGVVGELCVSGRVLSRGYLGQPALTAERFVCDPFAKEPGARMYHTGDFARRRNDGQIQFVGRKDLQVKIRGFRVELGEVEACLSRHAAVADCAVVARAARVEGGLRLVAYYMGNRAVEGEELKRFLLKSLPEYMVPAAYVWLARLPLTASGKVDRVLLPDPPISQPTFAENPAVGPLEQRVSHIWADLLDLEHVERDGNFFELGGHSLLATMLVMRVRSEFDIDIAVEDVFRAPVLVDFAHLVAVLKLNSVSDRVE